MPHINGVRLVNVAFNDAKSYFDDFTMIFRGKSATYDLENGGGKSVLLMMLLQVVLPNTSLREDKPLKNIFLGGKDRTSHVLVEWILDDGMPKKYLLTGFCARRSRDKKDDVESAEDLSVDVMELDERGIDYFNYYIMYDEPNPYDLRNLKLAENIGSGKRIMGFEELKQYIRTTIAQRYAAEYFHHRRGEYLDFIRGYNLIDAEWKVIKDINSGENSIEKYFRQNKTSRKLIENLLIKVIEDIEAKRPSVYSESSIKKAELADTLIEIRSNLNQYMKDKQNLDEYEKIQEFYSKIKSIDMNLKGYFEEIDALMKEAVFSLNRLKIDEDKLRNEKADIEKQIQVVVDNLRKVENERSCLEIQEIEFKKKKIDDELENLGENLEQLKRRKDELDSERKYSCAQNEYLKYKEELNRLKVAEKKLENLSKDEDQIVEQYRMMGFNYKKELEKIIAKNDEKKNSYSAALSDKRNKLREIDGLIGEANKNIGSCRSECNNLRVQKKKYENKERELILFLSDRGGMNIADIALLSVDKVNELSERVVGLEVSIGELQERRKQIGDMLTRAESKEMQLKNQIELIEERMKPPRRFLESYEQEKIKIDQLYKLYDVSGKLEELKSIINFQINKLRSHEADLRIQINIIQRKLDLLAEYGLYIPNEEILRVKDQISRKHNNIFLGIELLKSRGDDAARLLKDCPLLPFAVVAGEREFNKLIEEDDLFRNDLLSYPVPIVNIDALRSGYSFPEAQVLFVCGGNAPYVSHKERDEFKKELEKEQEDLKQKLYENRERLNNIESDKNRIERFESEFCEKIVEEKREEIDKLEKQRRNTFKNIEACIREIEEINEENKKIESDIFKAEHELEDIREIRDVVQSLVEIREELKQVQTGLEAAEKGLKQAENDLQKYEEQKRELDDEIWWLNNALKDIESAAHQYDGELKQLTAFSSGTYLDLGYEQAKAEFEAAKALNDRRIQEEEEIQKEIQERRDYMGYFLDRVKENGFTAEEFETKEKAEGPLQEIDNGYINDLTMRIKELDQRISAINQKMNRFDKDRAALVAIIEDRKQRLLEKGSAYEPVGDYKSEYEIQDAIRTAEAIMELYKRERKASEEKIAELDNSIDKLRNERERYKGSIIDLKIQYISEEAADRAIPYDEWRESYNKIEELIEREQKRWQREVMQITGRIQEFNIQEPIKELQELEVPDSLKAVLDAIKQMDECIYLIEEKKRKILDDIEVLEQYQAQFNKQCIQRAEWILDKLKKLPQLSRIEVNGTRRNMVEMTFHDFSEEEKIERMKAYIQSIIREIEQDKELDRAKISQRLSSKELLAQITDMDKVVVRLYKVESLEEHSGYKRWEYAVGSEGQSNALYFIFAVCLISYIRLLSMESISTRTKKVMIADNPFGPTSAVYLWEPMFNILKENDVQLIAPGHNIAKELTSKFEVNYLLNQDIMSDNRIKVVVKDVRTEENLDDMEFRPIEQMSFI